MKPNSLRGIFFDLDDTLIRYSEAERAALAVGCQRAATLKPAIPARSLAAAIYQVYAEQYCYGTPGFASLATMPVLEFRRQLTSEALLFFDIDDTDLTHLLVDTYRTAERAALATYAETIHTLNRLRPYFTLGIITNGPSSVQREKIVSLELERWFDLIIIDTEFGHPKPDPRIFDHAAQSAGLLPSELIFVGNSLEADVFGANSAAWTSVWINRESEEAGCGSARPDYEIGSMNELLSLPPVATSIAAHASKLLNIAR